MSAQSLTGISGLVAANSLLAMVGGVIFAVVATTCDPGFAHNGALAGLVSITAEPLTPTLGAATLIGAVGGVIVVFSIVGLDRLKIDDPVGAISVHGTAGIWGLLAVCLSNGDASLGAQLLGIVMIFGWVAITSAIVWFAIKATFGIRVSEEEEHEGVDIGECGLEAYPEFVQS